MNLDRLSALASRAQYLVAKVRSDSSREPRDRQAGDRLLDLAAVGSDLGRLAWELWQEAGQKAPRQRGR